jgi:hypothetical protein
MLNVLHRTTDNSLVVDRPTREDSERRSPPPPIRPAERAPGPSWPFGAKLIVAILAVLALAGAVGTVVGWTSDDETTTGDVTADSTTELQATIGELTAERDQLITARDDAVERVAALEASVATVETERDDAIAQLAELEATNDSLESERAVLEGQVTELEGQLTELEGQVTELEGQLTEMESELASATLDRDQLAAEVAQAETTIADLQSSLIAQIALTATAVNERDALAALFPLTVETSLQGVDLAGDYDADLSAVYCEGFSDCGTLPQFDELTIVETDEGWLRVEIDGYFDAGLFLTEGSLFAVAESTTAVLDCNGVTRSATVSLTLYAHGLTVTDDGSSAIDGLGASLMVQSPSIGSCARGLAFYGVELSPAS